MGRQKQQKQMSHRAACAALHATRARNVVCCRSRMHPTSADSHELKKT